MKFIWIIRIWFCRLSCGGHLTFVIFHFLTIYLSLCNVIKIRLIIKNKIFSKYQNHTILRKTINFRKCEEFSVSQNSLVFVTYVSVPGPTCLPQTTWQRYITSNFDDFNHKHCKYWYTGYVKKRNICISHKPPNWRQTVQVIQFNLDYAEVIQQELIRFHPMCSSKLYFHIKGHVY